MEEQNLQWGMHFCNSVMFKTVMKVESYICGQKAEGVTLPVYTSEHTKYCMTEYGQIYKLDKINLVSYELDLQKMEWFRNQDFVELCLNGSMRYTEMELFEDYYKFRKECACDQEIIPRETEIEK